MPKPILQPYYCIIKKKKFGEYDLIIRENTSTAKVRKELKKEGYRVLVCVTAHGLMKLQQAETFEEFLKERPSSYWNENAFNFMKEIKVGYGYDISSLYPSIIINNKMEELKMFKSYYELSEDQKEQARESHPNDYTEWSYKTIGVDIEFSCQ